MDDSAATSDIKTNTLDMKNEITGSSLNTASMGPWSATSRSRRNVGGLRPPSPKDGTDDNQTTDPEQVGVRCLPDRAADLRVTAVTIERPSPWLPRHGDGVAREAYMTGR